MSVVILTIGLPGVGKSSWASEYVKAHPEFIILSTDKERILQTGTYVCDRNTRFQIYDAVRDKARKHIIEGHSLVIDATNTDLSEWIAYQQLCLVYKAKLGCKVFNVPPEKAMEMQQHRSYIVPIDVVQEKWDQLVQNQGLIPYMFDFTL